MAKRSEEAKTSGKSHSFYLLPFTFAILLTKKYFVCASIDDDLVCRETIPFEVGLIGNTNKERNRTCSLEHKLIIWHVRDLVYVLHIMQEQEGKLHYA